MLIRKNDFTIIPHDHFCGNGLRYAGTAGRLVYDVLVSDCTTLFHTLKFISRSIPMSIYIGKLHLRGSIIKYKKRYLNQPQKSNCA